MLARCALGLVALLAGCGRFGFDDVPGDATIVSDASTDATDASDAMPDASGTTTIHVRVESPGTDGVLALEALEVRFDGLALDPGELHTLPEGAGIPTLPSEGTFVLPDASGTLTVLASARAVGKRIVEGQTTVTVTAGQNIDATVVLGADQPSSCFDNDTDGSETDTDCGGACSPCAVPFFCQTDADCQSQHCNLFTAFGGGPNGQCEPASLPWTPIAPAPRGRIGGVAAGRLDGTIAVYGGALSDSGGETAVDLYDPETDTWFAGPSLPVPQLRTAGACIDGTLWLVGGETATGGSTGATYSLAAGATAWEEESSLGTPRRALATAVHPDGRLFALGGGDSGNLVTDAAERLAPEGWVGSTPLPTKRRNFAALFNELELLLVIGGHPDDAQVVFSSVEQYSTQVSQWVAGPSLGVARSDLMAVLGADRRVYALGGRDPLTALATVEVLRPGGLAWIGTTPMATARDAGQAAVGADGRIYVIGGRFGNDGTTAAEAYGPRFHVGGAAGGATGSPGAAVVVSGRAFAPGAIVHVTFDNVPIQRFVTTASGALPAGSVIHIPATATVGKHVLTAIDDRAAYPAISGIAIQ